MIRITRFFYIHILVVPMVILAYCVGSGDTFFITYSVVLVHELSHIFCALALKVNVKSIALTPFGMSVRMPANLVKFPKKEILIALSGPFSNVLMIVVAYALSHTSLLTANLFLFYIANASVLLLNLIPIPPLDGGRVARAILFHCLGIAHGVKCMKLLSRLCVTLLLGLGVFAAIISHGNMSLFLICAFLIYSLAEEKRNSEILVMRSFIYEKERLNKSGMIPAKHILMQENVPLKTILKKLNYSSFYLVTIVDDSLSPLVTVTESDIVRAVCKKGYGITAKSLMTKGDKSGRFLKDDRRFLN